MKILVVSLMLVAFVCGIKYDALKVTFGQSKAKADREYFFTLPRSIHDAEGEGWHRTERPSGPLKDLIMYCHPGRIVCPLYDPAGFVAGLQIAIPVDSIDPALKPERYFEKWHAPAAGGEPHQVYWTATQYYASEDALKAGRGPTLENGATLQQGGVWVKGLDGKLMKMPAAEAELKKTAFKKQICIPNMGTHYYYNMTKQLDCDKFVPWFALLTKGELLGVGFQTFGKAPSASPDQSKWFEFTDTPSSRTELSKVLPHAPECLLDRYEFHDMLSIHIYYISEPWTLKCEAGDSI